MKKLSLNSNSNRNSLLTIYKTFVRPILDYADIICDKHLTKSLKDELEMVQYNAGLVLLVHLKVHRMTAFTKNSVWNPLLSRDGPVRYFSSTK